MSAGGQLRGCWHVLRLVNLRHLLGRRRRALLTVAGVAASVALVVAVTVVNETLRSAIDGTTRGLAGSADLEVAPGSAATLPQGSAAALRRVRGIGAVVPILRQIAPLAERGRATRSLLFGVPANLPQLFPQGLGDAATQTASTGFKHGVLLSPGLASTLGAQSGERIVLTTLHGRARLPVAGVLGHNPFAGVNGGEFGLLPLGLARHVFRQPGATSIAYVVTRSSRPDRTLRRAIQRQLGHPVAVRPPGGGAEAYKRTFDSIATVSEQTRLVALLVALFLVFNTMSMALAERRQELVLLTLGGARQPQVAAAFVVEAAIVGAIGSASGVLAGAALGSELVRHAADTYGILPITNPGSIAVSPAAAALGFGAGLGVAILGALLPARRILGVAPIDALRPEAAYEWGGRGIRRAGSLAAVGLALLAGVAFVAAFVRTDSRNWLLQVAFAVALLAAALLLPATVPSLTRLLRRAWLSPFGLVGRLAGDTLLRNPVRTVIVAGALALSASVVISVSTGLGSFDGEVKRSASMWYVAPLYVKAPGSTLYTSDQPLPDSLRAGLSRVPGVRAAYPIRYGAAVEGGHQVLVYAMPIAAAAAAGDRITQGVGISEPRLVRAMRRGEVVMSRYTARRRGLEVGDTFELPSIAGKRRLRIAGLFNDVATIDSLYMELSDYRRYTGDNLANRFTILVRRGARVGAVAANLRRYLREHGIPASVLGRDRMRAEVVASVEGLFSLARAIQVAALLLAGLIALNTMLTATLERRREFGLQRTIGMSRTQLAGSVMLESVTMAVIAGAIAVGLGLGIGLMMTITIENQLAWQIAFSPDVPVILATVAATLLIGALAALYPSWRATRQRLIELVQYE